MLPPLPGPQQQGGRTPAMCARIQALGLQQLLKQPVPLAAAVSGTSLSGIGSFITAVDTTGLPPLSSFLAPAATNAAPVTTTAAATSSAATALPAIELPDSKFLLHQHLQLDPQNPSRTIGHVDMLRGDHRTPAGPIVMIERRDLTAERIQELRQAEGLGPDQTLPALLRETAARLSRQPGHLRNPMPDPHIDFDQAVFRLMETQVSLGNYTVRDVEDWFTENDSWTRAQRRAELQRSASGSSTPTAAPALVAASRVPQ